VSHCAAPPAAWDGPIPGTPSAPRVCRKAVYLHPGCVFASREPTEATTILGSCVAVCLWDARLKIGGGNHFVLPRAGKSSSASPRFGDVAICSLVDGLVHLGCRMQDLRAKVFGGAAVVEAFRNRERHLGAMNVDVARALLAARGIPIVAEDVEGYRGRKVIYQTDNGIALVKLV
jgi:chemotaxis protein CheD